MGWEADDEAMRELRGAVHLRTASGQDLQCAVREGVGMVTSDLARSDQLHILGNGVVPQQAAYAMRMLMEALGE